jgi:transcriptional regulator with XRE-family HTH domain
LRCRCPDNGITTQAIAVEPKTLGQHLRKRRIELHLLQHEVSRVLGVHKGSVQNWERGVGSPSIQQIPRIIRFLGYDPEPEPKVWSQWIAFARRRLGLTQEDLAKSLSVDPVTVYRWEKGLSVAPADALQRLQELSGTGRQLTRQ